MENEQTHFIEAQVNQGYIDALIEEWLEKEPYSVRIRKNFQTACWAFRNNKHVIFVGDALYKTLKRALQRGDEYYIVSYFFHELSHSKETERDLRTLSKALKADGIPFRFHNLAEDARIEHLFRVRTGRPFRWADFERSPEGSNVPTSLLFAIIQQDGGTQGLESFEYFERVHAYYIRMIACSNSWDLIPILKEWREEFGSQSGDNAPQRGSTPQPPPEENEPPQSSEEESEENEANDADDLESEESEEDEADSEAEDPSDEATSTDEGPDDDGSESEEFDDPEEMTDLEESMMLNEDDDAFEEAMENSEEIEMLSGCSDPHDDEFEFHTVEIESCTTGTVRVPGFDGHWDKTEADFLAGEFKKLFRDKSVMQNTRTPTRRLNIPGLAIGNFDKPFREKTLLAQKRKKVCIIVDCSGSMRRAMPHMRVVLDVFSQLAHSGTAEGHVILSGVTHQGARTETYALPLSSEIIGELHGTHGAEGIANAMEVAMPLLQESDWNIVLTDGKINDAPIDKRYFNARRIKTLGIYLGLEENCDLLRWFDYAIVEPNPRGIVNKMMQLLA